MAREPSRRQILEGGLATAKRNVAFHRARTDKASQTGYALSRAIEIQAAWQDKLDEHLGRSKAA